jgi:acyl-CoA thioester hydrolase
LRRPPPTTRRDYRLLYPITTRWMDNDAYGHANNVVYYSWFDTAVNRFLIDAGVLDIARSPAVGLVAETGCRYHGSISYPDAVTIGLRVVRLGTSSVRYELAAFRNDEPGASADAHFVHVYVDRVTQRPVPIPDDARAAMQRLQA